MERNDNMKNKETNLIKVLQDLINGKSVTFADYRVSNPNQYFKTIKDNGIVLIELWKRNQNNNGKHLLRSLKQELDNKQKAKKYLQRLQHKAL